MTQLSRRTFLHNAALASGALLLPPALAACAGGSDGQHAVTSGNVTLKFWAHDPSQYKVFKQAAAGYRKSGKTKFAYGFDWTKADAATLVTRLISGAAAGGGSTPDMIGIVNLSFGRLMSGDIAQSLLMDLSSAVGPLSGNLIKPTLAQYSIDGKPYGIETDNSITVLYYREDLADKHKVPLDVQTWEEMAQFGAGLFKDQGKSLGIVCTGDSSNAFNQYLQFLEQRGGSIFDAKGNLVLESQAAVDVLQFMIDGRNSGFLLEVNDPYGPSMAAAFKSEKLIAVTMPDWYNQYGLQTNVPEQKGKWRITLMPRFAGGGTRASSLGGTGWAIVKDKDNSQAALDLLKYTYLTEEGQVQRFLIGGYLPTMKSVYSNPELAAYRDSYLGGQKVFDVYKQLAADVPPFYQSPKMQQVINVLGAQIVSALKGHTTAEKAITDAVKALNG
ncbi:extracellular solute-binding protein [Streptomyces sp. NPDC058228]|uniref:extracellular solute-binding protein n=1 Tax=Streptomyces sp. NPDC058228 TaxID=3346390 RepID=UPI0036E6F61C